MMFSRSAPSWMCTIGSVYVVNCSYFLELTQFTAKDCVSIHLCYKLLFCKWYIPLSQVIVHYRKPHLLPILITVLLLLPEEINVMRAAGLVVEVCLLSDRTR